MALVVWWYSHGRGGLEGSSRLASTCRTVGRCAIQSAIGHVATCLHPSAGAELAGVPQDCESWGRSVSDGAGRQGGVDSPTAGGVGQTPACRKSPQVKHPGFT